MRGPDVFNASGDGPPKLDGGRRRSQAARMQRCMQDFALDDPAPLDTLRQRFRPLSITRPHGDHDRPAPHVRPTVYTPFVPPRRRPPS